MFVFPMITAPASSSRVITSASYVGTKFCRIFDAHEVNADGMFTGVSGEYRVKNVKVGDEPLDLAKTYTLASHNYMLKSAGDGMAMFQGCTLLQDSVMIDNQVLINYIVDVLGGVVGEDYADPYGQGRITVIEKK